MDMSSIATLVGSVGFPIVACCGMAWFIATTFRNFNDLVTKNNVLTEELISLLRKENGAAARNTGSTSTRRPSAWSR